MNFFFQNKRYLLLYYKREDTLKTYPVLGNAEHYSRCNACGIRKVS